MIVTSRDMYVAVLDAINKENTGTVFPDEFNRLINEAQMDVVKNRYLDVERTQKRIDDLRELKTIQSLLPVGNTFTLPYTLTPATPGDHGYMFMLDARFKLNYVNNVCGLTGISDLLKARPLKSDFKTQILLDPYKRPADDNLYYEIIGTQLLLVNGTSSTANSAEIEFLKYPHDIELDVRDSILSVHLRQEIVDVAARKYLHRTQDPRYQSAHVENQNVAV